MWWCSSVKRENTFFVVQTYQDFLAGEGFKHILTHKLWSKRDDKFGVKKCSNIFQQTDLEEKNSLQVYILYKNMQKRCNIEKSKNPICPF